jgi:hypothetical protein
MASIRQLVVSRTFNIDAWPQFLRYIRSSVDSTEFDSAATTTKLNCKYLREFEATSETSLGDVRIAGGDLLEKHAIIGKANIRKVIPLSPADEVF